MNSMVKRAFSKRAYPLLQTAGLSHKVPGELTGPVGDLGATKGASSYPKEYPKNLGYYKHESYKTRSIGPRMRRIRGHVYINLSLIHI